MPIMQVNVKKLKPNNQKQKMNKKMLSLQSRLNQSQLIWRMVSYLTCFFVKLFGTQVLKEKTVGNNFLTSPATILVFYNNQHNLVNRKEFIKKMVQHAWQNYRKHTWGANELKPLALQPHSQPIFGGKKA